MFFAQPSKHLIQIFPPYLQFITRITISTLSDREPLKDSFFYLNNTCKISEQPQLILGRLVLYGLRQCHTLSCKLIDSYATSSHLNFSQKVLEPPIADASTTFCNRVLENLYKNGEYGKCLLVFREMGLKSIFQDECTYDFVLRSCYELFDFKFGEMVYGHLVKTGFDSFDFLKYASVDMLRKKIPFRNWPELAGEKLSSAVNDWNSLIFGVLQHGETKKCFRIFSHMRKERIDPDSMTVVNLLRSCIELNRLNLGRMIHALALVSKLCEDLIVNTALLTMYSRMKSLVDARKVFDKMPQRDTVVWNIMISAYSRHGFPLKSLELLVQMVKSGIKSDLFTALPVISSIAELKSLKQGKEVHGHVIRNGSDYQVSVLNCLMDMYCKSNCLNYAQMIFNVLQNKTVVSWSSMIKGYVSHEQFEDALSLFNKMKVEGFRIDAVTVINILPAFVNIGAFQQIKNLHGYSTKSAFTSVPAVTTALLASYAKCGCIELARKLFDDEETGIKDIISWNSMISAYAKHGDLCKCFELYKQMKQQQELRPDQLTFLSLLTGCVNSGSVREGLECFKEMTDEYGFRPSKEHYGCMVDLLGRAGYVKQASEVINAIPMEADARVFGPLLNACKIHSETGFLAEFAAEKLIALEPENAGNYVLLSNIYAAERKWEGVAKMRIHMRDKKLKKTPGCSWLEIKGNVHEFRAADKSHPQADFIFAILDTIEMELKYLKKLSFEDL